MTVIINPANTNCCVVSHKQSSRPVHPGTISIQRSFHQHMYVLFCPLIRDINVKS